jgi:small subunit ribosomal protein S20
MANSKGSRKRIDVNERNRLRNSAYRASVRTSIKKVHALVSTQASAEDIQSAFQFAQSLIDRAVSKKIFKPNKGARDKSRLFGLIERHAQAV